jgi:Ras-related protein Rab-32
MIKFWLLQQQNAEKREHLYKILVIGELGTGKTSIIKRYVHQFFSQHYRATIGVDFALKVLSWDQDTVIRLQLWDIAGTVVWLIQRSGINRRALNNHVLHF